MARGKYERPRRLRLEKTNATQIATQTAIQNATSPAKQNPIAVFVSKRSKSVFVKVPVWTVYIAWIIVAGLALGLFPILATFQIAEEANGTFPKLVLAHYYLLILGLTICAEGLVFYGFDCFFGSVIDPDKEQNGAVK